jgi:uncharacterized protein YaaR (DUF327 family)
MKKAGTTKNRQFLQQQLLTAIATGKQKNLLQSPDFMSMLGLNKSQRKLFASDTDAATYELASVLKGGAESIASRQEAAMGEVQKFQKIKGQDPEKAMRGVEYIRQVKDAIAMNTKIGVSLDNILVDGKGLTRIPGRTIQGPESEFSRFSKARIPDTSYTSKASYTVGGAGVEDVYKTLAGTMIERAQATGLDLQGLAQGEYQAKYKEPKEITAAQLGLQKETRIRGRGMMTAAYSGLALETKDVYTKESMDRIKELRRIRPDIDLRTKEGRGLFAEEMYKMRRDGAAGREDLKDFAMKYYDEGGIDTLARGWEKMKMASGVERAGKQGINFLGGISKGDLGKGATNANLQTFQKQVMKAFTGQIEDIDEMRALFSGDTGRAIAKRKGGIHLMEKFAEFKTIGDFQTFMGENAPTRTQGSFQERLQKLNEELTEVGKVISGEKTSAKVSNFDGSYSEEVNSVKKAQRVKEDLDRMRQDINPEWMRQMLGLSSQGRGVNTNVRPPVMNYWNNRWVL